MKRLIPSLILTALFVAACNTSAAPEATSEIVATVSEEAAPAAATDAPAPATETLASSEQDHSFETGSASIEIEIPLDGRLAEPIEIETEHGVRFTAAAGTLLRLNTGQFVTGPITIGIDDGQGFGELPADVTIDGTVRVYGLVETASGPELLKVLLEPAGKLWLNLGPEDAGTWRIYSPMDETGRLQGPLPDGIAAGTSGVLAAPANPAPSRQFTLGPAGLVHLDPNAPGPESDIGNLGITHYDFTGGGLGAAVEGTNYFELEIGGDEDDEWPRLWQFRILREADGQILAGDVAGIGQPGIGIGDDALGLASLGQELGYSVEVVGKNGSRFIRVRTRFNDKIRIVGFLCNEDGTQTPFGGVASGGSPDESAPGPYNGVIDISVDGWGEYEDHLEVFQTVFDTVFELGNAGGETALTSDNSFQAGDSGNFSSNFRAGGYSGSVQDIGAALPDDWEFDYGSRQIHITIPCPPPMAVDYSGQKIWLYDLESLKIVLSLTLDIPIQGTVLSPNGRELFIAGEKEIIEVTIPKLDPDATLLCDEVLTQQVPNTVNVDGVVMNCRYYDESNDNAGSNVVDVEIVWLSLKGLEPIVVPIVVNSRYAAG